MRKKVKYTGVRCMGTMRPRRMWTPGEILEVEDELAKELTGSPWFTLVKPMRKKKTKREEAEE